MVLDPIPQSLPVHFFGSRPQPPTSPPFRVFESRCNATSSETKSLELFDTKSLESLELLDKSKVARVVRLDQVASQATKSLELSNNSSDLRCDLIYWRTLLKDFLEWLSWKTSIRSSRWNEWSLQNIVSFMGLFCKRDLWNYSTLWVELRCDLIYRRTLLKDFEWSCFLSWKN